MGTLNEWHKKKNDIKTKNIHMDIIIHVDYGQKKNYNVNKENANR